MRKVDLVSKKWCDLVFEHKNKVYGAYLLRSEVGKRNQRALYGVCGLLMLLLGIYVGASAYQDFIWQQDLAKAMEAIEKDNKLKHNDVLLHFVDLTPQKPILTEEKPIIQTVPEIVEQVEIQTPLTTQPITEETAGITTEEVSTPEEVDTMQVSLPLPAPVVANPTAEEVVSTMPEFPGGIYKLIKWLDANIIYPPLLMKKGIEGTTYLTFYVDATGEASNFKIEEELHPMITSAILKAAERMPKWEPAKGDVNFTKIKITVPVTYHKL
ncbi:MAG: energy transducer TonB [Bacteroidaceae bacterium]|nr:energy transducer TonB [Bacteroidaceae bacterium]